MVLKRKSASLNVDHKTIAPYSACHDFHFSDMKLGIEESAYLTRCFGTNDCFNYKNFEIKGLTAYKQTECFKSGHCLITNLLCSHAFWIKSVMFPKLSENLCSEQNEGRSDVECNRNSRNWCFVVMEKTHWNTLTMRYFFQQCVDGSNLCI